MKLKYCDVRTRPEVIDNSKLRCFCHEPFTIRTGELYDADLGFNLVDELAMSRITVGGTIADDLFIVKVNLPFVKIINFGMTDVSFDRGMELCNLEFYLRFTLHLEN